MQRWAAHIVSLSPCAAHLPPHPASSPTVALHFLGSSISCSLNNTSLPLALEGAASTPGSSLNGNEIAWPLHPMQTRGAKVDTGPILLTARPQLGLLSLTVLCSSPRGRGSTSSIRSTVRALAGLPVVFLCKSSEPFSPLTGSLQHLTGLTTPSSLNRTSMAVVPPPTSLASSGVLCRLLHSPVQWGFSGSCPGLPGGAHPCSWL